MTDRVCCIALLLTASTFVSREMSSSQQFPKSQMPDLGRPTRPDDPLPTLDFEKYFTGRWNFEWDMPESPLGPAGHVTGTEVYSRGIDGRFFESEYEGEGPQGRFNGRAVIVYNRDAKTIARHDTDSRGFSTLSLGTVGADLGGAFTIYYETAPFNFRGKTLQLKQTMMMTSPVFYRVRVQLSAEGGAFVNLGQAWWRKEVR